MIDLHFFPTPNGHKVTIFLEEATLPYRVIPVDITKGEQFAPGFLAISPNNRIPALVDNAPPDGGAPISVFESGAILTYLAARTALFRPEDLRARTVVDAWLHWQVAGLAPNMGQWNHFARYGPERIPYAMERFEKEIGRLCGVMERRLETVPYLAGDYSIADMATFPWIAYIDKAGIDLSAFKALAEWMDRVGSRPAVARGLAVGMDLIPAEFTRPDAEMAKVLYGQTDQSVRAAAKSAVLKP